ncbi:hypothetical protein [Lacisediminihabitans changchengi]|uniref:Uncharacterized protein n=1 Tax=Lacisediminihabitans changchengi TaxID=2787634 RepID=A0A934SJC2_9MICO|nr:hypothetical protein [Lacisediminihabitans changchengi]MBK4346419.1 hypothetical protein [Lacisediminihabitans changchengi]
MSDAKKAAWEGEESTLPADELAARERQLALVDRVFGLEAQLSQVSAENSLTPSERLRTEQRLIAMQSSLAWRVGRAATAPLRVAQRFISRARTR